MPTPRSSTTWPRIPVPLTATRRRSSSWPALRDPDRARWPSTSSCHCVANARTCGSRRCLGMRWAAPREEACLVRWPVVPVARADQPWRLRLLVPPQGQRERARGHEERASRNQARHARVLRVVLLRGRRGSRRPPRRARERQHRLQPDSLPCRSLVRWMGALLRLKVGSQGRIS